MCLHLLLGPASSSRIFRLFYQQNSLPALSIVKNVSHARKTDFSHEKPVALWILADHCRGGGVWTNELGILPVFWASHPVFLSIQQRMGARGGGRTICTIGSWEVARIRRLCCRDNLSSFTGTQMNCLFPVFRDQDGVSRTYLHRLGMSQRPNSNPPSSRIHLGKHTFISSSTLLADTAKYDLGIRIWPGPHWTFGF